jgi:predicted MFS family arabinose efflux permease
MFVLLLTVFVDLVGFGIVIPILPFYAQAYGADAVTIMVLVATYSLGQLFAAPIWGRLSDRFGRKRILLLTLLGGALSYVWFAIAPDLLHLFLARGLSGVMAGNIAIAHAYAADITPPEDRARAIGRIGAAFGLGFVVGPALGGLLVQDNGDGSGYMWPFLAAAAMAMAAFLLGLAALREPPSRQQPQGRARSGLGDALQVARSNGIPVIILLNLMVTLSFTALIAVFPLWCQARLGWGPLEVGYAYTWIGLLIAGMQGGLIGPMTRRLGEQGVFLVGASCLCSGLFLSVFVASPVSFMLDAALLCAGSSFCHPMLTAMTSQRLGPDHQGAVLGLQNSVGSMGRDAASCPAGVEHDNSGTKADNSVKKYSKLLLPAFAVGLLPTNVVSADDHGIAMHGLPKYAADFRHFNYVNPDAGKGGRLTLGITGTA